MTDPMSLFVQIGSSLQAATNIAIGLSKLNATAEVNAKAIELQSVVLRLQSDAFSAQAQQSTMIQRIRELEEELARVEAWEETKQRYYLHQPVRGSFVYALKPECESSEPVHWICTNCYEKRKRSILQFSCASAGHNVYMCPECNSQVLTAPNKNPTPPTPLQMRPA